MPPKGLLWWVTIQQKGYHVTDYSIKIKSESYHTAWQNYCILPL